MNPTMGRTHLSHLGVPNHTAQLPQEKKPSRAPLRGGLFSAKPGLRARCSLAKIANKHEKHE